ncbi:MAG: hypothetical protein U5K79_11830 [Cyclobacteriaceae bacterium]|nr:hypothetical protein [Cyclobacteriaceae bacterium]
MKKIQLFWKEIGQGNSSMLISQVEPIAYLDVAKCQWQWPSRLTGLAGKLPACTMSVAKTALIEKGILPSATTKRGTLVGSTAKTTGKTVCNGGMIAASIRQSPKLITELATKH